MLQGLRVSCDVDTVHLDTLLRQLTSFGVRTLTSQPPTLEELFMRHYADADVGGEAAIAS